MTFRFLSPALAEITDAAEFYSRHEADLGVVFLDELDQAITRILQFPLAWAEIASGYRHCRLRRFPYSVIYTPERPDLILIVSVFHHSREPKSWRSNL